MPAHTLYLVVEDEALKANPRYNFSAAQAPPVGALSRPAAAGAYTISQYENLNAGFDLVTAEDFVGRPGQPHLLNLGVKAMMTRDGEPVHYWLAPRSSIFKTGHIMANSLGVIDNTYRGLLKAPVVALTEGAAGFKAGDRHFQILAPDMGWISQVIRVEKLPETERGEGGFGSTGR